MRGGPAILAGDGVACLLRRPMSFVGGRAVDVDDERERLTHKYQM